MSVTRLLPIILAATALSSRAWADIIATPTVATAPSATTVDLTNVANTLLGLAAVAVTTAVSVGLPLLMKRWGIANDSAMSAKVDAAVSDAGGIIYDFATKHVGGLANVDVHNAAWATALQHVADKVGPEVKSLGLTDATIKQMVQGAVGTLLAGDPTVTAGAPAQIPTPVLVPAPPPVHVVAPPAPAGTAVVTTGTAA
jgi:hypothetical protein